MKLPPYPKYKPSLPAEASAKAGGVAWLGNVPKHWEVKQLTATRLCNKAQGWTEERGPTLGNECPIVSSNPTGLWTLTVTMRGGETQPRWGWMRFAAVTQGSACRATLGWRPESRWDSRNGGRS